MCNEKRKEECNGLGVVVGEIFGGGLFWGGRLWLWVLSGPLVAKVALHRVSWGPRGGCNGIPRGKKHQIHAVSAEMSSQKCPPTPRPRMRDGGRWKWGWVTVGYQRCCVGFNSFTPKKQINPFHYSSPTEGPQNRKKWTYHPPPNTKARTPAAKCRSKRNVYAIFLLIALKEAAGWDFCLFRVCSPCPWYRFFCLYPLV